MTLAEALTALHRAGRIRSPWLPGMKTNGWMYMGRWAIACGGCSFVGVDTHGVKPGDPSLTDPATVGCLIALLREAVEPWTSDAKSGADIGKDRKGWMAWVSTGPGADDGFRADTEGEAIAKALIAVAEAL